MSLRVLGALLVAVAVIGGGMTIGGFDLPRFTPVQLALLVLLGVTLLLLGLLTERQRTPRPSGPTGRGGERKYSISVEFTVGRSLDGQGSGGTSTGGESAPTGD